MTNEDIKVSICCLVYNHEKYLGRCLEGFVNQKTDFRYEVLIHDDASTDSSPNIIREYEKRYPEIIKPIYQKQNQHSQGIQISRVFQYPRAKGKYIALCEGDDCWNDSHKLQQQYDALESHNKCVVCTHKVRCISESGHRLHRTIPFALFENKLDYTIIKSSEWIKMMTVQLPFQTSSYFIRSSILKEYSINTPEFTTASKVGDYPLMLYLSTKGDCYYINKEMSCYRMNSKGSWSQQTGKSKKEVILNMKRMKKMWMLFDKYTNNHYKTEIKNAYDSIGFYIHVANNDFWACINTRYKKIFRRLPIVTRISYIMFALFPFLRPMYVKVRSKI